MATEAIPVESEGALVTEGTDPAGSSEKAACAVEIKKFELMSQVYVV